MLWGWNWLSTFWPSSKAKGSKEETCICWKKALAASLCFSNSGAAAWANSSKPLLECPLESELRDEVYSLMLFFGEFSSSQESKSRGNSLDSMIWSLHSLLSNGVMRTLRASDSFHELQG